MGHIVPVRIYIAIFLSLIILTAVTVAVAFIDLGAGSDVVALAIASLKATLVALYFMHVKYSTRLTWLTVIGGVFWLLLLLGLVYSDYWSRGWLGVPGK